MKLLNISGNEKGYIALISVIIVAAILMVITFTLGFRSFMSRINILEAEFKERSIGLAEACMDTAIIRLQDDSDYTVSLPGISVIVGDESCFIKSISNTWPKIIRVQAKSPQSGGKISYTNLEVTVSLVSEVVTVESWKEVGFLP